jgi:hypothetical protein
MIEALVPGLVLGTIVGIAAPIFLAQWFADP